MARTGTSARPRLYEVGAGCGAGAGCSKDFWKLAATHADTI
jgi:hypothetical protein